METLIAFLCPLQVSLLDRELRSILEIVQAFIFAIPKARVRSPVLSVSRPDPSVVRDSALRAARVRNSAPLRPGGVNELLHASHVRQQLFFPGRMLVQFDCGKLQVNNPSPCSPSGYLFLERLDKGAGTRVGVSLVEVPRPSYSLPLLLVIPFSVSPACSLLDINPSPCRSSQC